ncbi:hypothetical protein BX666DRAFT_2029325 [Dichotomocladium elegans]|nr:hypothetical protein BX666DRAFT_2029325 [Dichotomocladium elegans]
MEYSTSEFCRSFPPQVKASSDRTKLFMEGKHILNALTGSGTHAVFLLHIAVANGLYVGHRVCSLDLPITLNEIKRLKTDTIPTLLSYRDVAQGCYESKPLKGFQPEAPYVMILPQVHLRKPCYDIYFL